ncbi:MAG: DUF4345 domain-containing protein [Deltaproteobacteria bacterium]|nr:MAG: DUF4345 domain-containing protein [Deltaproteobacteria bacterium]
MQSRETSRRTIWIGRVVLAGAATLMTRIAIAYIHDPVSAVAPHRIVLESAEAITIMRVSGGVFLGIAFVLVACLASDERLLTGLGMLAIIATTITAVRLVGAVIDGPAPFTLMVLKPEIVLVVASSVAFWLEYRRHGASGGVR